MRTVQTHRRLLRAALALLLWLPGLAALADFTDAYNAAARHEWDVAAREFKVLAEQGDMRAQAFLATMYRRGLGVPRDTRQAVHWYEQAAAQGHLSATYNLAVCLREGLGTPRDDARATALFETAARGGLVEAQVNIGLRLLDGVGAERDPVRGQAWLEKAATSGDSEAVRRRDYYAKRLPKDELEAARALAAEL